MVAIVLLFGSGFLVGEKKITFSHSSSEANVSSAKLDFNSVNEVYSELKDNFDGKIDGTAIEDGLKSGLVKAAGDPYTEFLNVEASKEFSEQLNGSFEGIGAELGKDKESIIIISPIDGFPAQKAGIKARDIIAKINDESAFDLNISDAVKKIRGPKGTSVKLDVVRDGKLLNFEITREQINIPSVKTELVNGNIAVIKISRFGSDTTDLVQKAAKDFKTKSVKGVILDMRGNPGGLLDSAVSVSSIWLPKGKTIVDERHDSKVIKTHYSSGNSILLGMPTVILVDGGSASASEIVAGALHDNGVAKIVGLKTFGKGSVQELRNLSDGGILKVTIAHWFTPAGKNINKEGIQPDQKVDITDDDIKASRDPQKDAAITQLR